MPTIIDSLFLELGIDVSKFSADQQKAIARIQQFESAAKRASGNAASSVKTVGDAFKDLAKESRIGSSADRLDNLAAKFKGLGISMQASGGIGTPFGAMAQGLGMLLSPAALGAAAIGLVGKEVWDFNKKMTDMNATLDRNAELAGMSTDKLWAMGQAAQTTGGNPAAVAASIANLQTALAGASIGAVSATSQLVGMARLSPYGARFNKGGFGAGVDEESLFKAVHAMYQQQGRAKTLALVTAYGLMNQDQADLAMSPGGWDEYKKAQAKAKAMKTGGGFEAVVQKSLTSQVGLGEKDIQSAINAEQAYGGIQGGMQTVVGLLTRMNAFLGSILGYVFELANHFNGSKAADAAQSTADAVKNFANKVAPGIFPAQSPEDIKQKKALAMDLLMKGGESPGNAAAMAGNFQAESNFAPFATSDNGAHIGVAQLDRTRQAAFARWAGYKIGSNKVSAIKQLIDQVNFSLFELKTTQRGAQRAMDAAHGLGNKTWAFEQGYERPGASDHSFFKRFEFAQEAMGGLQNMLDAATAPAASPTINNQIRNDTHVGGITINTPSTDPKAHAAAIGQHISKNPLLSPIAQATVAIATRGMPG